MTKSKQDKFKLDGEHKEFVINKLALHCGVTEIAESLKTDFGIDITPQGISHYKSEHEKEWRKKREYFNKHIAEIEPFADKSLRVQQRGNLIRDLIKYLWFEDVKVKGNQIVSSKAGIAERFKLKGNHDIINKLLDSIQKEIEPIKISHSDHTGDGPLEINVKLVE